MASCNAEVSRPQTIRTEAAMIAEGRDQAGPLGGRHSPMPAVGPRWGSRESAVCAKRVRGVDIAARVSADHAECGRELGVARLELAQQVRLHDVVVPEPGDPTTGREQSGRRVGTCGGVDPVPGVPTGDQVEAPSGVVPALEPGHFDVNAMLAGDGSHSLVGVDAQGPDPSTAQVERHLAGPTPNVEGGADVPAQQVIEQFPWVARPEQVIGLSAGPEGLGPVAISMQMLQRHDSSMSHAVEPNLNRLAPPTRPSSL